MFLFSIYRKLSESSQAASRKARKEKTFRPTVETLEERWVPSVMTITVTNLKDTPGGPGTTNLRQAINQVNTSTSATTYSIVFANSGTVLLNGSELELNPTNAGTTVNIIGAAGGDTISGNGTSRVLAIDDLTGSHTTVNLTNLNIQDGSTSGAGGGIYLEDSFGHLNLNNVVVSDNTATSGARVAASSPRARWRVTKSTVTSNKRPSSANGGGIYAGSGIVLNSSSIIGNTAGSAAGGVFVLGNVIGSNSHINSNSADLSVAAASTHQAIPFR